MLFTVYPAKIFAETSLHHNKRVAHLAINVAFCGRGHYFCRLGKQAWAVAGCETGQTYNRFASNGQYKGIFQMGTNERAQFGFAWNVWEQAKSAKRYFNYSLRINGYGWRPWSCLPY
jgi:hypothetical protein